MPATLDVSCPNCQTRLKVPAEVAGKRIKCKKCEGVFVAKAPAAAPAPAPAPAAPMKVADALGFQTEDDNTPMQVIKDDDIPRCPHCAKELDPPDAVICVNCGFNNRTREKAETKKVWEATGGDWASHLAPGIVAVLIAVGCITFDLICFFNMKDWMTGSFLDREEIGPDGGPTFWIKPGAFTTFITVASLTAIVPACRFAYKRLVKEYVPPEQVKK